MEHVVIAILLLIPFWGIVFALLAKRKNRNPLGWGVVGSALWLITFSWIFVPLWHIIPLWFIVFSWYIAPVWTIILIFLVFMPCRCPRCGQPLTSKQAKGKTCPICGSFGASLARALPPRYRPKEILLRILVGIGIMAALVPIADSVLPPERIEHHVLMLEGNEVSYPICGTGGGFGSCELKSPPPSEHSGAVLIKRSRLLNRCTVEPLHRKSASCNKSCHVGSIPFFRSCYD
jgi:hypothetical protein